MADKIYTVWQYSPRTRMWPLIAANLLGVYGGFLYVEMDYRRKQEEFWRHSPGKNPPSYKPWWMPLDKVKISPEDFEVGEVESTEAARPPMMR